MPPTLDQLMAGERRQELGERRHEPGERRGALRPVGGPGRRRRTAARGMAWSLAALFLLGAGAVGRGALIPTSPASRAAASSSANAAVLGGPVAWVSRRGLYVAPSVAGTPGPIWRGRGASSPQWSHDGQWIAFVVRGGGSEALWTARADGQHRHLLVKAPWLAFTWSPTSDAVAVSGPGLGVRVYPVEGRSFTALAGSYVVSSFAWSSTGSSIAASVPVDSSSPSSAEQVLVVSAYRGSHPTPKVEWTGPPADGVIIHSWWPNDNGLVLWLNPGYSGSAPLRGLQLFSLSLPATSGTPGTSGAARRLRYLATTVVYFPWVVWSPGGDRLAVVQGSGEPPWSNKSIAVCRVPSGGCTTIHQPKGTVSIGPAWSPDGTSLAFVRALSEAGRPAGNRSLHRWYRTRRLWVRSAGSLAHLVSGAPRGVAAPAWIEGGTAIGFSTPNGVGVVPSGGGHSSIVAAHLKGSSSEGAGPDGYGKAPWGGTAVWSA